MRDAERPPIPNPSPGEIGIEMETVRLQPGHSTGWGLLSAHRWFAVVEGSGEIRGPDRASEFAEGDLLLAPAGLRHQVIAGSHEHVKLVFMRLRWRAFGAAQDVDRLGVMVVQALCRLVRSGGYRLDLPRELRDATTRRFLRMRDLALGHCPGRPLQLKAELLSVLSDLLDCPAVQDKIGTAGPEPGNIAGIRAVLAHVEAHFADPIGVDEAAAIAHMGRSRFHAHFRKATGTSFTQHLTRVRINKAAELLQKTPRSVLDIALACGFGSLSRFYEAFSEIMQTSPVRWRKGGKQSVAQNLLFLRNIK
ncbi:MAG: helix-turn-helix domain-containing protein [Phycisphaerae bacterium]